MSLQLALLLLGVFVVAAVGLSAYDKMRVKRRLSAVERTRSEPELDDLEEEPQMIPPQPDPAARVLSPADMPLPEKSDDPFDQELQDLEEMAAMPLGIGLARGSQQSRTFGGQGAPDPKIDFVINLPGASAVPRDQALAIYKQEEYLLEKPHHIYGLRHGTAVWSNLERDPEQTWYTDIAVAIQMLDQRGTIGESELTRFSQLALKLADALQRPTKLSMDFEEALQRAQELNQFCNAYDVFASINIVPEEGNVPFTGRAVETAARRLGMEFGPMNIFHMKNNGAAGGRHLFSMANLYQPGEFDPETLDSIIVRGLTVFMNVPCVNNPVQVFQKMADTGSSLCALLGGRMLDNDRQDLSLQGLSAIRLQIEQIAADMQGHGILPGSESALRLFHNA